MYRYILVFIAAMFSAACNGNAHYDTDKLSLAMAEALMSEAKHIVVVSEITSDLYLKWNQSRSPLMAAFSEVSEGIAGSVHFRALYVQDYVGMEHPPAVLPLFVPVTMPHHDLSVSPSGQAWILIIERISERHSGISLLNEEIDKNQWIAEKGWVVNSYISAHGLQTSAIPIDWGSDESRSRLQQMYMMLNVSVDQFMHELDRLYAIANIFSQSKRNSEDTYVEFYANLFESELSRSILKQLIDQKYSQAEGSNTP